MGRPCEDLRAALAAADRSARAGFGSRPVGATALPCTAGMHTLDVELIDDAGPVGGAAYRIVLPDGAVRTGTLSIAGRAALEGLPAAGLCTVEFPEYRRDASAAQAELVDDVLGVLIVYQGALAPRVTTDAAYVFVLPDWDIVALNLGVADPGSVPEHSADAIGDEAADDWEIIDIDAEISG